MVGDVPDGRLLAEPAGDDFSQGQGGEREVSQAVVGGDGHAADDAAFAPQAVDHGMVGDRAAVHPAGGGPPARGGTPSGSASCKRSMLATSSCTPGEYFENSSS